MEYFYETEERVILVGVQAGDGDDMNESLDELGELAATAGAVVAGRIIQNREAIHPATYIGKGKIEEGYDADLCILNQELDLEKVMMKGSLR